MEKWKKRSIDLLTSVLFTNDSDPSVVPYYPQKRGISAHEYKYFKRTAPEKQGISSRRLYDMLAELEGERRANMHSLMVVRGGEVILECSRPGYNVNIAHLSHSMSKTVTGMAVGMLVDEGRLSTDERLVDIFPDVEYRDKRFAEITVHHLLTMTSGVAFSEVGSVTDNEWHKSFFASSLRFAPGSKFHYNSMNSYILAKIVTYITGKTLSEFLGERLFRPLGITNYLWEMGPEGVEKGGWGLYLSPESWAKLGYMVLSDGVFNGERILSSEWIRLSSQTGAISPEANGAFNYGYQLWVGRREREILFNGMLGQNVWICPKNDLVVVITAGNNELFQDSPALEIIRKYLGSDIRDEINVRDYKMLRAKADSFFASRRWVRPREKRRTLASLIGMCTATPFDGEWEQMLGRYAFAKNTVGILPLIARAMQNNMSSAITELALERHGERLFLAVRESERLYHLEVGLYEYKESILDFRGEKYIVFAMGEAVCDSEGAYEFRIELLFPEIPNTRMITLSHRDGETVMCEFSEVPNNQMVEALVDRATSGAVIEAVIGVLEGRFGESFIHKKIEETFSPELIGINVESDEFEGLMRAERERVEKMSSSVKLLRAFVDKFFGEDDAKEESVEKEKGFFGKIVSDIMRKK